MAGYGGHYQRQVQDLHKNKPKKKYDYSTFKSGGASSRYYSFTIKEHYDEVAGDKNFSLMEGFLKTSIAKQKEREAKILAGSGYTGPNALRDFINAYTENVGGELTGSSNIAEAVGHLMIDWVLEQEDIDWQRRQKMSNVKLIRVQSKIGKELNGIVSEFDDNFKKIFIDRVAEGKVPNVELTKRGALKIGDKGYRVADYGNKGYGTKTDLKKLVNGVLNGVRGEITEYALVNGLNKAANYMLKNVDVTGGRTRKSGQKVKADLSGELTHKEEVITVGVSSKAYQIKNPDSPVPLSMHDTSLEAMAKYMGNYQGFSSKDMDNFIFNFVNIYNFVSSGGMNEDRSTTRDYSVDYFGSNYLNILTAVTNAAAMWFGTAILGKPGAELFKGDSGHLAQVDFLVVTGVVIPISQVLEHIRDNAHSIEIQFPERRSMDAEEVYRKKLAEVSRVGDSGVGKPFNYPPSILKVGRTYGRAAAGARALVKFNYVANSFIRG